MPERISSILSAFGGVPIFFGLSGFLIWDSIKRTSNFKQYLHKRILRLYPELWGGVLLNFVLIICLYNSQIQWGQYLLFQGTQATVLQFWTPDCLRGYGCGTPNGSLWTIGVMVQCYVVIWFAYKVLHKKNLCRWILILAIGIMCNAIKQVTPNFLPSIIDKLFSQTFIPYIWMFFIGAFVAENFEKCIPIIKRFWLIFYALAQLVRIVGVDFGVYGTFYFSFLILSIIGFGYWANWIKVKMDLSYGFYIYHMIVINAMIQTGHTEDWIYVPIALVCSVSLSWISFYTLGALSRKRRKVLSSN